MASVRDSIKRRYDTLNGANDRAERSCKKCVLPFNLVNLSSVCQGLLAPVETNTRSGIQDQARESAGGLASSSGTESAIG